MGFYQVPHSKNADESEGFIKNPDEEKGGGTDLRLLLLFPSGVDQ
jgi:hypothetical protein